MRVTILGGLAVLLAAAAFVPLPVRVIDDGRLVDVAEHVSVQVHPSFTTSAATGARAVNGAYLGSTSVTRATLVQVVAGAVRPSTDLARSRPEGQGPTETLTAAALSGLGIAPVRVNPDEVPVSVAATAPVARDSAAAALHVFDLVADVDLAQGRTIAVLGFVSADLGLHCLADVAAGVRAAVAAGARLIVVGRGCDEPARAALGDARGRVVPAASLYDAITALQ